MKPFTPPSQAPTYRSFQFADSMEGTQVTNLIFSGIMLTTSLMMTTMQASLARNRKNSHYPDYDPNSNFNSRGQTQNSVRFKFLSVSFKQPLFMHPFPGGAARPSGLAGLWYCEGCIWSARSCYLQPGCYVILIYCHIFRY